ncbi:MAG: rhomboid family intramembrane serine protease, partial [Hyphomicrobium sp.]
MFVRFSSGGEETSRVTSQEPIFNVPGAVLAVIVLLIAVQLVHLVLSPQESEWLILAMAFIPARYAGFASEIPGGDTASITSFVTHIFVHGDWFHLAINSAWMLAFGSVLSRRMGSARFLAFSLGGGIAGALAFLAA